MIETEAPPALTTRETQVLALLAEGFTNHRIAQRLKISPHTTKFHVRNVCFKLGVGNRTKAVAVAMRGGLIAS